MKPRPTIPEPRRSAVYIALKDALMLAGKTQGQIAKQTGINDKVISSWLTGRRVDSLTYGQMYRVLLALGITVCEFEALVASVESDLCGRKTA